MEALAIIGLTGTIAQLLDFSAKLISKTTELYSSVTGALDENVDAELVTNHFATLIKQLDSEMPPSQELASICNACRAISTRLLGILQGLKKNTEGHTWKSIRHAIRSMLKNGEIQALQARLVVLKNELIVSLMIGLSRDLSQIRIESRNSLSRLESAADNLSTMMSTLSLKVDRSHMTQETVIETLLHENANNMTAFMEKAREMIQLSLQNEAAVFTSKLLQELSRQYNDDQSGLSSNEVSHYLRHCDSKLDQSPKRGNCVKNNEPLVIQRSGQRRRRLVHRSNKSSWFGRILVSVTEIYMGDDLTHILTGCIVIPSPWILRLRCGVKVQHLRSMITREAPRVSLRPLQVLPKDSAIFNAINSGNAHAAESIIRAKDVSPSAVSINGENLLSMIAAEMLDILFNLYFRSKGIDSEEGRVPRYSDEERRSAESTFYNLRQLFEFVLAQGVDPAQKSSDGSSAISCLLYVLQFGFDRLFPDDFYTLFSSSLSASQDNPFDQPYANVVGALLRLYSLEPSWRYRSFIDRLLEGIEWTLCCPEGPGEASALALRHSMGDRFDVDQDDFEAWVPLKDALNDSFQNFFSRRLKVVKYLSSSIQDALDRMFEMDGCNQVGRVVERTKNAVQLSLLYASPMKGLRIAKDSIQFVRQCVIQEVCAMLQALGCFIPTIEDEMLDWCNEWEVLDIWVESLLRGSAHPIPRKTRKAWNTSKATYNDLNASRSLA
ncbi:uncharacterized protein FFB14_03155 [Fusarium fujikuroi]|nr:uncharacterized protein FFB14_03155 [Fusarium fujikuroi]